MADITILNRFLAGATRGLDISSNTIVTQSVKVGGSVSNTELTKAILDRLVSLQNGSDVGAGYHTHDTVYTRTTALSSTTSGSAGSTLIGDNNSYTNFTPASATVKAAFTAIDTALGTAGSAANKTLSNLNSPVAANQDISPDTNITRSLGTASLNWQNLWVQNIHYASTGAYINVQTSQLVDSSANNSVGWQVRHLYYTDGTTQMLDWSQAGLLDLKTNRAANAADPVNPQDLVTLSYMSARLLGLAPKKAVFAASAATLPTYTYNNGTSGVGATITASANGALSLDGQSPAASSRVLIKDETAGNAPYNGIYTVTQAGDGTHPFILTRATDMNEVSPVDEINGAWVPVQNGTVNAGRVYVQYGTVSTVGTDNINFEFYNPIAGLTGGDMIVVSGSTISVDIATTSGLASTNPGNAAGQLKIKLEASNPTLQIDGSNQLGSKLDAARAITTGASGIGVNVDGTSLDISGNALEVKASGVTLAKMASNSVDESKIVSTTLSATGALTGGSGTKVAWNPDGTSLEINSNAARVKSGAYDQATITGGSGSAAAVQYSPSIKNVYVAGQAFTANTSYAVRWGVTANGETAGRVYAADITTTSYDLFYVIGMMSSATSVSAGQNVTVTKFGEFTLSSADTTFAGTAASNDGKAVFLTATGTFSLTPPSTAGQAITRIGVLKIGSGTATSNIIDVNPHAIGVN